MELNLHLGAHCSGQTAVIDQFTKATHQLRKAQIKHFGAQYLREGLLAGVYNQFGRVPPLGRKSALFSAGRIALQRHKAAQDGMRAVHLTLLDGLGPLRDNVILARLYPSSQPRLKQFASVLGAVDRIFIGIQSYSTYWSETMMVLARQGHALPTRPLCRSLARQTRRWRDVIQDVAEVFPASEINVWSYEAHANDLTDLFAKITGLERSALAPLPTIGHDLHLATVTQHRLRDQAQPHDTAIINGHYCLFSPLERAHMTAVYKDDLTWLMDGAGGIAKWLNSSGMSPARAKAAGTQTASHTAKQQGPQPEIEAFGAIGQ